ncbi:MAG TPA: M56 family metallopeptidase [Thermoanaerobaculia bacterium]|jgi:beta-lactamase regulating signal transducer with metallopeptidase domain|nr:M56 family metallopeptidase [Thermoanaerobaculia bacterium]
MLAQAALAWLLTYLLHSTLLLSLAWLASKPLARWSVAAEETMWKLALVGALLTASLQLAAGWEPAAGRWRLAEISPTAPAVMETSERTARTEGTSRTGMDVPFRVAPAAISDAAVPSRPERSSSSSLPAAFLGLWALGATLLLGTYARSFSRIQQRLRSRPRVVGGSLLTQLRELAAGAGLGRPVRLSCSSRVPVPLALGIRQPEICLPPRALAGLTEEQQQGLLAHELAHLVRRDPLWLVVSHLLTAALFFQPLNWVARRRLREISEILSDEWAVTFTGRPLSLAGCLAEVAGWSAGLRPLPLPGMADRPSNLARRIRLLLDDTRAPEHPARRLWLAAGMVAVLVAVAAAAPAVSASRQEAPKPPEEKAAVAPAPETAAVKVTDQSWVDARPEHDKTPRAGDRDEQAKVAAEDREDAADAENPENIADFDFGDSSIDGAMAAADAAMEKVSASMGEPLDALNEQLASARDAGLSTEQQRKLERDIERTTRDIQKRLQPRLEQLSREMGRNMARMKTLDPEMERLTREMAKLATQMRPSEEALEHLSAEAHKLQAEGSLSREEREKLTAEARRLAESMKPTAEQRRQIEALRDEMHKRHGEMRHEVKAEHREEIEKAQAEMREEIEREMRGVREELHRALQERYQVDHEERREHREKAVREKMKEKKSKMMEKDKQKQDKQKMKEKKDKEVRKDSDASR